MRQQSRKALHQAKRPLLTVEVLEDRRVFSLTGLAPSLLSQAVPLPPAVNAIAPTAVLPAGQRAVAPVADVLTSTADVTKPLFSSLPVAGLDADVRLDTGAGGV